MGRFTRLAAVAALSAAGLLVAAAPARAAASPQFFDWSDPGIPGGPNFIPSPFLNDNNAAQVAAIFNAELAADPKAVLAVKVNTPLTNAAAINIFTQYKVSYVFGDFEDVTATGFTRSMVDIVQSSGTSKGAHVGNFNFYDLTSNIVDPTRPGSINTSAPSFKHPSNEKQYDDSGANMQNAELYPGSPDYRTPSNLNGHTPDSNAPNIRSADFILPIMRNRLVTQFLAKGELNIPWVVRFNNFGNTALQNGPNGQFIQAAANPADGQLPSRGDFQAQVLHYRLSGANTLNLFTDAALNTGIVGYSISQMRSDALTGWTQPAVDAMFTHSNFTLYVPPQDKQHRDLINSQDGGVKRTTTMEQLGVALSGIYDKSGSNRQLVLLLSNLDSTSHIIELYKAIDGKSIHNPNEPSFPNQKKGDDDDVLVAAGTHLLLQFTLDTKNNVWDLNSNTAIFTDNNRDGIGIPEPATLSLFGVASLLVLGRRSRRPLSA